MCYVDLMNEDLNPHPDTRSTTKTTRERLTIYQCQTNVGQNQISGLNTILYENPVNNWRISFDGKNDLNDFLSKVEMYTKFESTPDNVLMSRVRYLFCKRALSWYRVHYKDYKCWTVLRCVLIEVFFTKSLGFPNNESNK